MSFAEPKETASLFSRVQCLRNPLSNDVNLGNVVLFFSAGANVPQKPHLRRINKTWRTLFYDPAAGHGTAAELRFGGRTLFAIKKPQLPGFDRHLHLFRKLLQEFTLLRRELLRNVYAHQDIHVSVPASAQPWHPAPPYAKP